MFSGTCALFASLGIGRFALGMLLPAMGVELQLSYAQMGIISTLNFCGYLSAVLLCGYFSRICGTRLLVFIALTMVGGSMLLIGSVENLWLIMGLYFVTGVGSALSNVPIMALLAVWFKPLYRGRVAGVMVMGNGLGIVMSGYLVPVLNNCGYGWQLSWLCLGGIALIAALCSGLLLRNEPEPELAEQILAASMVQHSVAHQESIGEPPPWYRKIYLHCGAIYFLFGFTYVIYVTFLVTSLVQERGMIEQSAGVIWSWVGLLSLVSGPLFGYVSDRFGRRNALMAVFSIQSVAYLFAISGLPLYALYGSVFCFGIVAWSIPSIMAALVGDIAGPARAATIFGFVTFVFGIGQISGPYCAGLLAEHTGGFTMSFLMASLLAIAAVVLSARLPIQMKG
ncbi:MAG: YbfB/YjiJ family MFS transporter [Desulfobulbaceae bacterium]|nr:MAG: YbfB/YjiJ family MFS transporter [Desulfobulbaceae bacterium]